MSPYIERMRVNLYDSFLETMIVFGGREERAYENIAQIVSNADFQKSLGNLPKWVVAPQHKELISLYREKNVSAIIKAKEKNRIRKVFKNYVLKGLSCI